jgi:hypothetical protein
MRIVEHINKVREARDNHLHQVNLVWTLGDGSESDQGRVSFLPISILDVLGDEGDDWLNYIIANDLGNLNEAAASREVHTKLVIFLVLIADPACILPVHPIIHLLIVRVLHLFVTLIVVLLLILELVFFILLIVLLALTALPVAALARAHL